jgi:hypothetical protein
MPSHGITIAQCKGAYQRGFPMDLDGRTPEHKDAGFGGLTFQILV